MTLQPKRILVVDDEPEICAIIGIFLNLDGHETEEAYSGADALRKLERGTTFDAIFTDFCMPGMSGDQLVEAICQRDTEHPPVVMITGFPPTPLPLEISKVILKPFDRIAIREVLRQVAG